MRRRALAGTIAGSGPGGGCYNTGERQHVNRFLYFGKSHAEGDVLTLVATLGLVIAMACGLARMVAG
jgi:hypothetical protein